MLTLVLTLVLTLLGAPTVRAEGKGIYEPMPLKTRDAEIIKMANEMEELFQRRAAILPDGPETQLVRRIGAAVSPKAPTDSYERFRFAVIDSPVPNAFALPDGQVYVHSGLLAILENEAQLAAVLAHECMHVEGHHSIVHARQAREKAGGMLALSALLGPVGNLINIGFVAAIIGYGRDLEAEADRNAIPRILDAGFDAREMPRVFELLDRDPEAEHLPVSAVWSDHPLGAERRRYTSEILDTLATSIDEAAAQGKIVVGREGFLDQVKLISEQTARDLIEADRPRTALDIIHRLRDAYPADPDVGVLLGDCLVALDARTPEPEPEELTKKAKRAKRKDQSTRAAYERARTRLSAADAADALSANRALAQAAYDQVLAISPEHLGALAGLGALCEKRGADVDAGRYYGRYLQSAAPTNPMRSTIVARMKVLTERLKRAASPTPAPAHAGATP